MAVFICSISPISTRFQILQQQQKSYFTTRFPTVLFFPHCLSAGHGLNCDPLLVSAQGDGGACAEGSPEEGRGPGGRHGGATHPGQQVTQVSRHGLEGNWGSKNKKPDSSWTTGNACVLSCARRPLGQQQQQQKLAPLVCEDFVDSTLSAHPC